MATNFNLWIDEPDSTSSGNVMTQEDFAQDSQRSLGYEAGQTISAKRLNTILREMSLITTALMDQFCGTSTVTLMSTLANVKTALANGIASKADLTTLAGTVSSQGTSISTLQGNIQSIGTTISGIQSDIGNLGTTVSGLSSDVTSLSGRVGTLENRIPVLDGTLDTFTKAMWVEESPYGTGREIKGITLDAGLYLVIYKFVPLHYPEYWRRFFTTIMYFNGELESISSSFPMTDYIIRIKTNGQIRYSIFNDSTDEWDDSNAMHQEIYVKKLFAASV